MWEANGQELEVAMYVRCIVIAESPMSTAADRTLVLRQAEYLGVSIPGLARNRWRIGEVPEDEGRATPPARRSAATVRDRLRVINGGST
jgi:hypothetical protein